MDNLLYCKDLHGPPEPEQARLQETSEADWKSSQGGRIHQTIDGRFDVSSCVYGEVSIFSVVDLEESLRVEELPRIRRS